jgi:dTDP-4-amino-4,6-dideoxygalactose transaminase
MPVSFVDLAAQDAGLVSAIHAELDALVQRPNWILGGSVASFEEEFAAYCETRHAIGTDSGLSALELALRAFGIGPGDEVVTAANTFVATALAITHTGATPVLVDVDPESQSLDPSLLEGALTERTRAVVPVHLHGRPAEMDAILAFARAHGLVVLEDACQAHGARYRDRRVGSLGDAAAFSFYPAKNLGAWGDGGMVVTDDPELAETIRLLRHYGQRTKNVHELRGFNRRLDTLQAAILRLKLAHLDGWNESRRGAAELYRQALQGTGVALPPDDDDLRESVWHLYVVRTQGRDELQASLAAQGIDTGIHYPTPIHLQPAYLELGYGPGSFPVSELLASEILSLPMHPSLTSGDVLDVSDAIRRFAGEDVHALDAELASVAAASARIVADARAA